MRVFFLRVFAVALIPSLLQNSATAYLNCTTIILERSGSAHAQTFFSSEALMERPEAATFPGPQQAPRSFEALRQLISTVRNITGVTQRPPLSEGILTLTDGTQIGFKEYGDPRGIPVLYFPGAWGSRDEPAAFQLDRLKNVRLIAVERYGVGLSSPKTNPTVEQWAAHMADFLDRRVGKDTKVAILGYSLGARYALACAADAALAPRLLKVGLVSSLGETTRESDMNEYSTAMQTLYRNARRYKGPEVADNLMNSQASQWVQSIRDEGWRERYEKSMGSYAEDDKRILNAPGMLDARRQNWLKALEPGEQGWIWDMVAVTKPSTYRLRDIDVPIDLYYGTEDTMVPARVSENIFSRLTVPERRLFPRPHKGHFFITEEIADIANGLVEPPLQRPRLQRLKAWVLNRRGSSSFSKRREIVIMSGALIVFLIVLGLATFGLRGWTGHHPALLLPVQIFLGIPGVLISSFLGYRIETRLIEPYRATIDFLRVRKFIRMSFSFGVTISRYLFYGWLLLKIPGFWGMPAPYARAVVNTVLLGPLLLEPLSFYVKARLLGRKGALDATEETKSSLRDTFSALTVMWFAVILVGTSMPDSLSNFAVISVGTVLYNFFMIYPERSPGFTRLKKMNASGLFRWSGKLYRWIYAPLLYNRSFFGIFLGASWWTFQGVALFREGYFIDGILGRFWDTLSLIVIGLLLAREMGPWLSAHHDVEEAKNYASTFLNQRSFLKFNYPKNWHERVAHTQLIDYPFEPLLEAFKKAEPFTDAYQQLKIALTINHRLLGFQKIRDLYDEFHDRDEDLDEIFQSMQYTSVPSADKADGYWGRLQNRRTYRGRAKETHRILIDAMVRLHEQHPGERLEISDVAASDATISLELAEAFQEAGIDYVRVHASDKAHEFYIVSGLDPRSKETLVFDADGHLLQASSPKGRLWVRWTMVASYPSWSKRLKENAIMWLNGTLRFGGRKAWIKKMEELYRQAQQPKAESAYGHSNGNGLKIQKVDLINPRAREFAQKYPQLFQIDEPTNILQPLSQPFHAVRLWSLGMRGEAAYHSDAMINDMLANVGLSVVVGGLVVSGTKGTLKSPEKLIREVYIVNEDRLELLPEHSEGYSPYPASIPLRRPPQEARQAA